MTRIDPISRWLHARQVTHPPVILMYHAVTAGRGTPSWPWAVSLARFRAQLDFLQDAGYDTPTVSELLREAPQASPRIAVITFDDGYVDNLAAWEELNRRGMKATWYVTTGYLNQAHPWQTDARPRSRLLSPAELRAMAESGMEIGSHTITHPRLPELGDEDLRRELMDSKSRLEDLLGRQVPSFAYPYGKWDERCEAAVKAAGYASACHTRTGWALRDGNPYRLRRLTVFNKDSTSVLARKLAWGSHDVAWQQVARHALSQIAARI
ncbi:polysaccharide deacetylase family protein [Thiobacter aerophilum]|uniref:Polysaccharide deacetylase family protein n=1 Tax=Thiobacter aerophilum TaxID=3121275 RepID=A0ABV0EDN3_9BURK